MSHLIVYLHPLGVGEARMIDHQLLPEHGTQAVGELGGEGNLWHQIKDIIPIVQGIGNQVDIHFCLAAGGYAVQERHIVALPCEQHSLQCALLLGIQGMRRGDVARVLAQA